MMTMIPPHLIAAIVAVFLLKSVVSLSSSSSKTSPSPTSADIRFDEWCDRNGIYRVGVQTVTTPLSLGGRGLFATRSLQKGAVVASIPSNLVMAQEYEDNGEELEWQVSLTNQIMARKDDPDNQWIQSWKGTGKMEIENFFRNNDERMIDEFITGMVGQGSITREGAVAELKERLQNYNRRLQKIVSREDAARWYSLALSRAACLGKEWDYKAGLCPFFDMLNHCHDASNANTELVTFGSCLDRASNKDDSGGAKSNKSEDDVGLQRKDLLLVLTKGVAEGNELLTQYETDTQNEENQLKLWIQYGIPPP